MAFWDSWPTWAKIAAPIGVLGAGYLLLRGGRGGGGGSGDAGDGGGDAVLPLITPSTGPSFPAGLSNFGGSDYAPPGGGGGPSGAGSPPNTGSNPAAPDGSTSGPTTGQGPVPGGPDPNESLEAEIKRTQANQAFNDSLRALERAITDKLDKARNNIARIRDKPGKETPAQKRDINQIKARIAQWQKELADIRSKFKPL